MMMKVYTLSKNHRNEKTGKSVRKQMFVYLLAFCHSTFCSLPKVMMCFRISLIVIINIKFLNFSSVCRSLLVSRPRWKEEGKIFSWLETSTNDTKTFTLGSIQSFNDVETLHKQMIHAADFLYFDQNIQKQQATDAKPSCEKLHLFN